MPRDRILNAAYRENIELHAQGRGGWYTAVLKWLTANQMEVGPSLDAAALFEKAVLAHLHSERGVEGTKHVHYRSLKDYDNYQPEPYLELGNYHFRRIIAQIRTGSNFLEVEMGRRSGTAHEDRICKCCSLQQVEDETHFIFECEGYDTIREKYCELFGHACLRDFFQNGDLKAVAKFLTECKNHRTSVLQ